MGAHPVPRHKDVRSKAALLFSAPAYPWENPLNEHHSAIMVMTGDEDAPALGPDVPRRILYDRATPRKFYLVL